MQTSKIGKNLIRNGHEYFTQAVSVQFVIYFIKRKLSVKTERLKEYDHKCVGTTIRHFMILMASNET